MPIVPRVFRKVSR